LLGFLAVPFSFVALALVVGVWYVGLVLAMPLRLLWLGGFYVLFVLCLGGVWYLVGVDKGNSSYIVVK
jgi:hypothetical protein